MLTIFATLPVDVLEHIDASQSVFGVARDVAALNGVASASSLSTSAVPAFSFERRTLLDEVELERMEEPGGGTLDPACAPRRPTHAGFLEMFATSPGLCWSARWRPGSASWVYRAT